MKCVDCTDSETRRVSHRHAVLFERTYPKTPLNAKFARQVARKCLAQFCQDGDRIEFMGNCAVQHFYVVTPTGGDRDVYAELVEVQLNTGV